MFMPGAQQRTQTGPMSEENQKPENGGKDPSFNPLPIHRHLVRQYVDEYGGEDHECKRHKPVQQQKHPGDDLQRILGTM